MTVCNDSNESLTEPQTLIGTSHESWHSQILVVDTVANTIIEFKLN